MVKSKAFIDTNVILDLLLNREGMPYAKTILKSLDKSACVISLPSFYTIAFYVERFLKKTGIVGEQKMNRLRAILNSLLCVVTVASIDESQLSQGINDTDFVDVEDSFQLQTAMASGCKVIITNNTKDFKKTTALRVVTPKDFVEEL